MAGRVSILDVKEWKRHGDKIPMITAYDYTTARLVDESGIPLILVGDSLGQVVLGYESTIPVTMEDILSHTKAVVKGTKRSMVIGDMPFMSYHLSVEQALQNAGRLVQEGGANAVKLEGGKNVVDKVTRIVDCGIPVMGHIGLTPQSVNQLGGYKVQGKTSEAAARLLEDALLLEESGAFAVVLELVPEPLSKIITERLSIPTIGIGAGRFCDGQVQVYHDMMGLFIDFYPKHAKRYAQLADVIKQAVFKYAAEVRSGEFPTEHNSYSMDEGLLTGIIKGKGR